MFMPLKVVMNPPNSSITSEGMGGKIFSMAISKKMPKYPYWLTVSIINSFILRSGQNYSTGPGRLLKPFSGELRARPYKQITIKLEYLQ